MKEARLQNPVLMNKNCILRRVSVWDEVARHTEVHYLPHNSLRRCSSDRRKVMHLTRGDLQFHVLKQEKSAEVIVPI